MFKPEKFLNCINMFHTRCIVSRYIESQIIYMSLFIFSLDALDSGTHSQ